MCGRLTQGYTWRELITLSVLTRPGLNLQPRYNIAPAMTINVPIPRGADRLGFSPMHWGLIPWRWKKTAEEASSYFQRALKR